MQAYSFAMRLWRGILLIAVAVMAAAPPGSKPPYPGAKVDPAGTDQAKLASMSQPELDVTVFTSGDPFDKVYAHFKTSAREFKMIGSRVRKLPNGQELRDAFFILDGGEDLSASKNWVKIQRPYIGQFGLARNSAPTDIRDVTAIVVTKKK
jgi:hypothetical protein